MDLLSITILTIVDYFKNVYIESSNDILVVVGTFLDVTGAFVM